MEEKKDEITRAGQTTEVPIIRELDIKIMIGPCNGMDGIPRQLF